MASTTSALTDTIISWLTAVAFGGGMGAITAATPAASARAMGVTPGGASLI
jgi:hypothetical protein